ncbi:hypothetical protein [Pantoea sp. 1.19]|uniref:hypothetical protein n=1 Tax=Pantoea sp. 1.19 TaxID=1925589 RepID=UPI000948CF3B|nr:hypothetical protein [Pantoea sp. 1.19]
MRKTRGCAWLLLLISLAACSVPPAASVLPHGGTHQLSTHGGVTDSAELPDEHIDAPRSRPACYAGDRPMRV